MTTKTIDMTPTWEETANVLFTLAQRGDAQGQQHALDEMRRMGKLADIASIVLGAHRRDDAPMPIDRDVLRQACVELIAKL